VSPARIIADVAALDTENAIEWGACYLIKGIAIGRAQQLAEGEWLYPEEEARKITDLSGLLPRFGEPSYGLMPPMSFQEMHTPRAVLMHRIYERPAIVTESDLVGMGETYSRSIEKAFDFHRACILASPSRIAMPYVVHVVLSDVVSTSMTTGMAVSRDAEVSKAAEIDIDEVVRLLMLLRRFKQKKQIGLAVDRLMRARFEDVPVNQAIDYGLALEIITAGSGRGIADRIASRTAWFLGTDPDQRRQVWHQARAVYAARSSAAHTGTLEGKSQAFSGGAADQLLRRLVVTLLELGEFPDWDAITLGAPIVVPFD
jgi:hypothetical protein